MGRSCGLPLAPEDVDAALEVHQDVGTQIEPTEQISAPGLSGAEACIISSA